MDPKTENRRGLNGGSFNRAICYLTRDCAELDSDTGTVAVYENRTSWTWCSLQVSDTRLIHSTQLEFRVVACGLKASNCAKFGHRQISNMGRGED